MMISSSIYLMINSKQSTKRFLFVVNIHLEISVSKNITFTATISDSILNTEITSKFLSFLITSKINKNTEAAVHHINKLNIR